MSLTNVHILFVTSAGCRTNTECNIIIIFIIIIIITLFSFDSLSLGWEIDDEENVIFDDIFVMFSCNEIPGQYGETQQTSNFAYCKNWCCS